MIATLVSQDDDFSGAIRAVTGVLFGARQNHHCLGGPVLPNRQ
jgi:hypothetical protein